MKQFDDSMSLEKRGYGRIEVRKEGWTDGEVLTPFGIVTVYAQGDAENVPHTRLDFVWNGRLYMRNFGDKRYSPRGIVTKAMKFAAEIAAPNGEVRGASRPAGEASSREAANSTVVLGAICPGKE